MGKEYIEREAALNAAYKIGKKEYDWGRVSNTATVMVVEDYLRAIPAADVVERKHGNWINPRPDSEMCSACGVRFSISSLFAVGGNEEPNYCPNCGADMRGEGDV